MNKLKMFINVEFLSRTNYRLALILETILICCYIIISYYLWKAVFESSYEDFIYVFLYLIFVRVISVIYPRHLIADIGSNIRSGNILFDLLKPISFIKVKLYSSLGILFFNLIFVSSIIFVFGVTLLGWDKLSILKIENIIGFIIILSITYIMVFIFELTISFLGFFVGNTRGLSRIKSSIIIILAGEVVPINLYPSFLAKIVYYLPFRYFFDYPINYLFGESDKSFSSIVFNQVIWIMIFAVICVLIKNKAMKRIIINGG